MKIFSPYITSKNILGKDCAKDISHFLVFVKNILNVLYNTKNNSVQNIPSGKF